MPENAYTKRRRDVKALSVKVANRTPIRFNVAIMPLGRLCYLYPTLEILNIRYAMIMLDHDHVLPGDSACLYPHLQNLTLSVLPPQVHLRTPSLVSLHVRDYADMLSLAETIQHSPNLRRIRVSHVHSVHSFMRIDEEVRHCQHQSLLSERVWTSLSTWSHDLQEFHLSTRTWNDFFDTSLIVATDHKELLSTLNLSIGIPMMIGSLSTILKLCVAGVNNGGIVDASRKVEAKLQKTRPLLARLQQCTLEDILYNDKENEIIDLFQALSSVTNLCLSLRSAKRQLQQRSHDDGDADDDNNDNVEIEEKDSKTLMWMNVDASRRLGCDIVLKTRNEDKNEMISMPHLVELGINCECNDWILQQLGNCPKLRHIKINNITNHHKNNTCARDNLRVVPVDDNTHETLLNPESISGLIHRYQQCNHVDVNMNSLAHIEVLMHVSEFSPGYATYVPLELYPWLSSTTKIPHLPYTKMFCLMSGGPTAAASPTSTTSTSPGRKLPLLTIHLHQNNKQASCSDYHISYIIYLFGDVCTRLSIGYVSETLDFKVSLLTGHPCKITDFTIHRHTQ